MPDRKSLSDALRALHHSRMKVGEENRVLAESIGHFLDIIEAGGAAITPDESGHLSAAIDALREGHPYLARSNILLALDSINRPVAPGGYHPTDVATLRAKLRSLDVCLAA